jgi:hypothetical protein
VYENGVLRRILGRKRDETIGGWKKKKRNCMMRSFLT